MARTVNVEAHSSRRDAILDAAQRLIYTKGYEQMTIQDILDALGMSKGAFYHYFDSKPALLEALLDRIHTRAEAVALPVVRDPHLGALVKFEKLFTSISAWKTLHKAELLPLVPIMYSDDNAIFWRKSRTQGVAWMTPLLCDVIRQGVAEGVMHVSSPDLAGQVIMSLVMGCGDDLLNLVLARVSRFDSFDEGFRLPIDEFMRILGAYQEGMERVLGAPPGSLSMSDEETLREWAAPTSP